jgi:hypothetical protein
MKEGSVQSLTRPREIIKDFLTPQDYNSNSTQNLPNLTTAGKRTRQYQHATRAAGMKLVSPNVIVNLLKSDETKESLPDTGKVFAALSSMLEKKTRMSERKEKRLESPMKISGS